MLAVPKNLVKDPRKGALEQASGSLIDRCVQTACLAVGLLAAFNIVVAYRDALAHRQRAAALERELDGARARNERLQVRVRGLTRDPALMERWLRERERTLPGEEVLR